MKGIITIDGERYQSGLPAFKDCEAIMNAMPYDSVFWKSRRTFLLWGTDHNGNRVVEEFLPHRPNRGECAHGLAGPGFMNNWRPYLKPIKGNGEFDRFILKNYKNGKLLKGGTLYIDGKPVSITDGANMRGATKTDLRFDSREIMIGDTISGFEIPWIVWDGYLIAERIVLFNISADSLEEKKLLTPIHAPARGTT